MNNIKDIDTLKLANTIPSNDDKTNMIAKLVIETANLNREIEKRDKVINEARRILGEYKHYSTPDEIQNMFNEEIVDKAYIILHKNLESKDE